MAIGVLALAALLERALRFEHDRWLDRGETVPDPRLIGDDP
ncbi:MAG TPA: hypothetical protein VJ979_07260 [Actinomycetota bacterium]|nr:hypothetical protein [Actinomycetota bacterium]